MRQGPSGADYYSGSVRFDADKETGLRNPSSDLPNERKRSSWAKTKPIAEVLASKLSATNIETGLHIVATPIGNLSDITLRAVAVLRAADAIACEDTRVTGKLKSEFGLTAKLIQYHEHNADRVTPGIIKRLKSGETIALVSDAGTPLVSDPGYRLVKTALHNDISIISVPGASALLAALTVSGLPTDRFVFEGFLPTKSIARRKKLNRMTEVDATIIFYESPKRLAISLGDMAKILGNRDAIIARELTKRFERVARGTLAELATQINSAPRLKGEITIVIAPPEVAVPISNEEIDSLLRAALVDQSVRDAANIIAGATGLPRRLIYRRAIKLKTKFSLKS
ncbi:MAG: 16S rRNA (cytidine(1402)-2'-O)-methyltransferase [Rhodospirillaceae bacterium]|nr:16S rRNA (cytidine(1402)-2'-O)-methyltransferase [Rhodospirillaceae bacterium]